jgi:glucokinase
MTPLFLAIEIGGTKLQLCVGDASGHILARWRYAVDAAAGGIGIRQQIDAALRDILPQYAVDAVGVGYGGPVDWKTGQICCSHQVEGWADFPLGDWLREKTAKPVTIDNDANVATLGEALCGVGRTRNPVFYVTLGSGVGGGLVVDGRIYHGARPGESEIGHVRLDRSGTIVEQRCSGWAVDARIRDAVRASSDSILARLAQGSSTAEARHLAPALERGCSVARGILDEACIDLAFGLSHVVHLFHPEVIVLGGGLSLVGEPLRAGVAHALGGFVMQAFAPGPKVALAALREDAVPVGALLLAAGHMHANSAHTPAQRPAR